MIISVGSDHRGVGVKTRIGEFLLSMKHEVDDCGAHSTDSCDYPDVAHAVAAKVGNGDSQRGILICGSGIGMSIAANKNPPVRAALCHDAVAAEMSRRHNDANVLCLSADLLEKIPDDQLRSIIGPWLETDFEGGRHQRRVDKITSGVKSVCHE